VTGAGTRLAFRGGTDSQIPGPSDEGCAPNPAYQAGAGTSASGGWDLRVGKKNHLSEISLFAARGAYGAGPLLPTSFPPTSAKGQTWPGGHFPRPGHIDFRRGGGRQIETCFVFAVQSRDRGRLTGADGGAGWAIEGRGLDRRPFRLEGGVRDEGFWRNPGRQGRLGGNGKWGGRGSTWLRGRIDAGFPRESGFKTLAQNGRDRFLTQFTYRQAGLRGKVGDTDGILVYRHGTMDKGPNTCAPLRTHRDEEIGSGPHGWRFPGREHGHGKGKAWRRECVTGFACGIRDEAAWAPPRSRI